MEVSVKSGEGQSSIRQLTKISYKKALAFLAREHFRLTNYSKHGANLAPRESDV
jgi:hypothetical protein